MESILNIPHGLVFWTVINFGIFLFLLIKFGGKGIVKAINAREQSIQHAIDSADAANRNAMKLLVESQDKLDNTQAQVAEMMAKGREQADLHIKKATEEAEAVKKSKIQDALKEIERTKEAALVQLRSEVADLVVQATEQILMEKLDGAKDKKLINDFIDKLPNN